MATCENDAAASYGAVPETEPTKPRPVTGLGTTGDPDAKDEPQDFLEQCAPCVAEFIGTFLIVFTMGCNSICGDPLWNPTGLGCVVLVAVYSFGPVSGADLNPAVTLARFFAGKRDLMRLPVYVAAQLAGGMVGAVAYFYILGAAKAPVLAPSKPFNLLDAAIVEAIYTGMLCFVVLNCVASDRNNKRDDQNHFFALAIGFVYIAGGYPCANISGAFFSPAASLAIGVMSHEWINILVYVGAQCAAAWGASFLFAIVRPEDYNWQNGGAVEEFEVPVRAKLISELVGTFFIVMTVGLNLVMAEAAKCQAGPWSDAAAYVSLIYSLGDVSGGHFNPSVTIAVVLSRRGICSYSMGLSYILKQLIAAGAAGLLYAHFHLAAPTGKTGLEVLEPNAGYGWAEVCSAQVLFTALACFAYLAAATSTMPPSTTATNFYYGLVVGACICIGGYAIGAICDGSLNPACALGAIIAYIRHVLDASVAIHWNQILKALGFSFVELAGGVLAASLYAVTHQKEYLKDGTGYPHIP